MTEIPSIAKRSCQSCGIDLPEGELFYECRTEIIAGKDSRIPDFDNPDRVIAQALAAMEDRDEQELVNDVYQEFNILLCPECRLLFVDLISNMYNRCDSCQQCAGKTKVKKEGKILQFPGKKPETKE